MSSLVVLIMGDLVVLIYIQTCWFYPINQSDGDVVYGTVANVLPHRVIDNATALHVNISLSISHHWSLSNVITVNKIALTISDIVTRLKQLCLVHMAPSNEPWISHI